MPNNPLFHPMPDMSRSHTVRDQIQIALAIADPIILKSLLLNSMPAITEPQRLGSVSSRVGVPINEHRAADGVLSFEAIQCVLANPQSQVDASTNDRNRDSKELARMTQHESEMHTLGQNLPLAPAIAVLENSGFCPGQINEILRLPHYAWYKSWWYAIDINGDFTIPFLRCIRTFHYPDGTLTLQYRDFFESEKPAAFATASQQVLIFIRSDNQGFGEVLQQVNQQRAALSIQRAILICNTISELEAQAFISQGISVYPAMELILPIQANCIECARRECPMNGVTNSPVAACYGFLVQSEFV